MVILTKILAKIPVVILAKTTLVILTKILAKIPVVILAKILAKKPILILTNILAKIPVVNLTKIFAKIPIVFLRYNFGGLSMCGFEVIEAGLYSSLPPLPQEAKPQPCMHRVRCSLACRLTFLYRGYWSLLELLIIVFEVFFMVIVSFYRRNWTLKKRI